MRGTATYDGEDLYIEFEADMVRSDYGVPGSPVWYEPDGIEITKLVIALEVVTVDDLPVSLTQAIMEYARECEWSLIDD